MRLGLPVSSVTFVKKQKYLLLHEKEDEKTNRTQHEEELSLSSLGVHQSLPACNDSNWCGILWRLHGSSTIVLGNSGKFVTLETSRYMKFV
jgi:hypothetical protein